MRAVRLTLERPDSITASAISARQQISLAIADRIRQVQKAKDLEHIAEDVLPQIEKFLESPEERRLRRIRAGLITTAIGLGATIGALMLALNDTDLIPLMAPALVLFLVGVGVTINGLWFTVPRKQLPDSDLINVPADQPELVHRANAQNMSTPTPYQLPSSSVTEHTTHHLAGNDV